MKYCTKPTHNMALNLRYNLPLNEREQATLDMYKTLCKNKKLIEVLGSSCVVINIDESIDRGIFTTELKVDIRLKQVLLLKE